jgi:peptidoglycan/LPS O-acetylase OafA/YrhL
MEARSTSGRPETLPSLTGLRFLAAMCILFAHSGNIYPQILAAKHRTLTAHFVYFGMTLFFVLSGFVITYNYLDLFRSRSRREAAYTFFTARIARLMPLFFFLFILTMATMPLAARWKQQGYLLPLFLTQTDNFFGFWAHGQPQPGIDRLGIAWSVAAEWTFYLFFPLFAVFLSRVNTRRAALLAGAACYLAGLGALYLFHSDRGVHNSWCLVIKGTPPPSTFEGSNIGIAYGCGFFRMFEFVIGCVAARFFQLIPPGAPSRRERLFAHAGFAAVCLAAFALEKHLSSINPMELIGIKNYPEISFLALIRMNLLHAPLIAYVLVYTARYASPVASVLNWRPVVMAGEASYSMYLLHPWLLGLFSFQGLGATKVNASILAEALFRCCVVYGFVIIVARGVYLLVEVPGKDAVRRVAKYLAPPYARPAVSCAFVVFLYCLPVIGVATSIIMFHRMM